MLEEIKVFVAVVNAGSFTLAAATLETSRSLISKKLTELEARLGVQLLNRTTRRLSLTEAGEQFFKRCSLSLNDIDQAVDEVLSLSGEPRGRLYVNLPMSFGILHIAPLVGEFVKRYPSIQLDLNFDDRKVEMIEPGFDLSIRIADLKDSSLAAKRLGPCHHVVVASPAYIKQYGCPSSPDAIGVPPHLVASYRFQASPVEWHFKDAKNNSTRVKVAPSIIANNSLAIREIVLSGTAVARMPTFVVGADLAAGRLVNLFPGLKTSSISIYAVFPTRENLPNKTRVFIDFLAEKIQLIPWWDDF